MLQLQFIIAYYQQISISYDISSSIQLKGPCSKPRLIIEISFRWSNKDLISFHLWYDIKFRLNENNKTNGICKATFWLTMVMLAFFKGSVHLFYYCCFVLTFSTCHVTWIVSRRQSTNNIYTKYEKRYHFYNFCLLISSFILFIVL